jgi:hypothetical protein
VREPFLTAAPEYKTSKKLQRLIQKYLQRKQRQKQRQQQVSERVFELLLSSMSVKWSWIFRISCLTLAELVNYKQLVKQTWEACMIKLYQNVGHAIAISKYVLKHSIKRVNVQHSS